MLLYLSLSVLVIPDFFIPFREKLDRSWTAVVPQVRARVLSSSRLLVFLALGDEVDSGYLPFTKSLRKTQLY